MQNQPSYHNQSLNNLPISSYRSHVPHININGQPQYQTTSFKPLYTHLPINHMPIYSPTQWQLHKYPAQISASTLIQRQVPITNNHNHKIYVKYGQPENNYQSDNHFNLANPIGYSYHHKNTSNYHTHLPLIQNQHFSLGQRPHFLYNQRNFQRQMYQFKPLKRTDEAQFIKRSIKMAAEKAHMIENILQTEDEQHTNCKCKNEVNYNVIEEDDKTDAPFCKAWC